MNQSRKLAATLAAGCIAAVLSISDRVPEWPARPVTVIVPLAAGGNTDMMARLAAQHLTEKLGQSFVSSTTAPAQAAQPRVAGSRPRRPMGYNAFYAGVDAAPHPAPAKAQLRSGQAAPSRDQCGNGRPGDCDQTRAPCAHASGISRLREGKSGQAEFCCRRNALPHADTERIRLLAAGTAQRTPDEARNRALLTNLAPSRPISRTSRLIRQRRYHRRRDRPRSANAQVG